MEQTLTMARQAESSSFPAQAYTDLLRRLAALNYRFVTPTPATHTRVIARSGRERAQTLDDVLGWSLPFEPALIPADILGALDAAGAIERREDGLLKATVRVSRVHDILFIHSALSDAGGGRGVPRPRQLPLRRLHRGQGTADAW